MLLGRDKLKAELQRIAKRMGDGKVEAGFMQGATYPDKEGTPVAAVAFWNEFGTSESPARPFFRNMIAKESPTWGRKMAGLMKASDYDGTKTLGIMGEDLRDAIKESINTLSSPPLAASTVKAKGFDKPLIDTSHMINSVDYEVKS